MSALLWTYHINGLAPSARKNERPNYSLPPMLWSSGRNLSCTKSTQTVYNAPLKENQGCIEFFGLLCPKAQASVAKLPPHPKTLQGPPSGCLLHRTKVNISKFLKFLKFFYWGQTPGRKGNASCKLTSGQTLYLSPDLLMWSHKCPLSWPPDSHGKSFLQSKNLAWPGFSKSSHSFWIWQVGSHRQVSDPTHSRSGWRKGASYKLASWGARFKEQGGAIFGIAYRFSSVCYCPPTSKSYSIHLWSSPTWLFHLLNVQGWEGL